MIEVYTDGASRGNPGLSGAGIYIKANGKTFEYSFPLGTLSNHEAEFHAVMKALDICKTSFPGEILSFRSDSQIVVDSIEKNYTKNKQFIPLLEQIKQKGNVFPYFFIKWIPNKDNKRADDLAKKAINMN
ncbi:MAG TPA: RNase H family protein [Candidatus Avamphibacillus sp.]|nr:RNase H family protein [Candidatus Avamphibacillus sp.]